MKIFVSYSSQDDNKRRAFVSALESATPPFMPIVVAARREPGVPLAQKVMACIREADVLVPILTRSSITNQWVNQEIGFAQGIGRDLVPIVESGVLHELKGFVHDQNDLPFVFAGDRVRKQRESAMFRQAYLQLIEYLQNQRAGTLTSLIVPARVPVGGQYTTRVAFKGVVRDGFFDNYVVHLGSSFRRWNWDPNTMPGIRPANTAPGTLNGHVDVESEYTYATDGWPPGRYRIHVRLYSHLTPGEVGRVVIAENTHDFEVYEGQTA